MKSTRRVLGHSLLRLLFRLHHSLIRLLRTARFARALRCAHSFVRSLTRFHAVTAHCATVGWKSMQSGRSMYLTTHSSICLIVSFPLLNFIWMGKCEVGLSIFILIWSMERSVLAFEVLNPTWVSNFDRKKKEKKTRRKQNKKKRIQNPLSYTHLPISSNGPRSQNNSHMLENLIGWHFENLLLFTMPEKRPTFSVYFRDELKIVVFSFSLC